MTHFEREEFEALKKQLAELTSRVAALERDGEHRRTVVYEPFRVLTRSELRRIHQLDGADVPRPTAPEVP